MKRAEEEDVMVYAIGLAPAGVGGGGGSGAAARIAGARTGRIGGRGRRPRAVRRQPDEGLPKIAAATGGGYFELTSTNDLAATFARVADELHHQYALGFTPSALDGKMHSLEVHVKRRGDEGARPKELSRAQASDSSPKFQ